MISTPERPQPPSIEDPEEGSADLWTLGNEDDDGESSSGEPTDWLKLAKDAYRGSTSYVDSNYRKQWEDSIRAFNNEHPQDSKYSSEAFRKRSNLYRPKTRAVIRKNEAAAAAAFFSNMDRISVTAQNQADPKERLSADVMKEILQYRLTKSIPWFQLVIGGIQDGMVQGVVASHNYWLFKATKKGEILEDRPVIDLIPIENIRFDPAASWVDPVNTSPYLIHLIPMYICDIKDRMNRPDPKGRTWKHLDDQILYAEAGEDDPTRSARNQGRQDATKERRLVSEYDVIWVHRHIHRVSGRDCEFYTLNSKRMLTDPEPLKSTVFHGKRPYVIGTCVLETHKPMSTPLPMLVKGLQDEANELSNQTLDNGKFILNKSYLVKRGKNVDIASLVRNVPGRVTLVDNMEDVEQQETTELPASTFALQDRNNADFDDLAGNFSAAATQTQQVGRQSATGMTLLQAPTTILTEYMLKTYVETFVQPVLRQLVLLEQHYETDNTILSLAGQKAQSFQKYGVDKITDDILDRELTITVNVGMGATDPVTRLQKFLYGLQSMSAISKIPPPGVDLTESFKEIFALMGYQEGDRFMSGQDPQKAKMQQIVQLLMRQLQQAKMQIKDKSEANRAKVLVADKNNQAKLLIAQLENDHENKRLLAQHIMELDRMQNEHALNPKPNGQDTLQ